MTFEVEAVTWRRFPETRPEFEHEPRYLTVNCEGMWHLHTYYDVDDWEAQGVEFWTVLDGPRRMR